MRYYKVNGVTDEIAQDLDTQFSVLNEMNMQYFDVRGVEGKNIADLTDEELQQMKEKMEKRGVKVHIVSSPIGKVMLNEPFDTYFELYKRVVQITKGLGTKYIRMFSFYHIAGNYLTVRDWTEEERTEVFFRLEKMIAYAKEQDVVLLHENERGIYGESPDHCIELMKAFYGSHFKMIFDPANFVQCGHDVMYAYENLKEYIDCVHVKDARYSDQKVLPAGFGDGNVEFIIHDLLDSGFDGFFCLEPHLFRIDKLAGEDFKGLADDLPVDNGIGAFILAYRALGAILDKKGKWGQWTD